MKVFFLWFGLAVLSVCFAYAVLKATFVLFRTSRQIKALPAVKHGDVTVIRDKKLKTAFTHGLLYPKIYISQGFMNSLDNSELKAVYLHELHHKNRKDPLRFFILSIARDAFFYIPISRFVERFIHNRTEIQADDAVVVAMKEPVSLAGALLKIAGFNKLAPAGIKQGDMLMLQPASINGIGSVENRIKRLVDEKEEKVKLPPAKAIVISIFISGFLMLSLSFPLFASFPDAGSCDMKHCAAHMNKLGKDCQNHCEVSKHIH
ncbi:MAG: M56 family metallopeptidase [Deltaproteobacteria bacterium]|nr:M56 family metallopeptidase [Deltaproteobacteria bacterium]